VFPAVLQAANGATHIGHQIDLPGSTYEVGVHGFADALSVADQSVNRSTESVNTHRGSDLALGEEARSLCDEGAIQVGKQVRRSEVGLLSSHGDCGPD
jgi:hypothetical protein